MSTRASISFYNGDERLVSLYHHWDGYISGLGYELASWLKERIIGNGIPLNRPSKNFCNGIGCLVAQYIRDNKTEIGGLYVEPQEIETDRFIDYHYKVVIQNDDNCFNEEKSADDVTTIIVTCWSNPEPIFVGKPSELLQFDENYD